MHMHLFQASYVYFVQLKKGYAIPINVNIFIIIWWFKGYWLHRQISQWGLIVRIELAQNHLLFCTLCSLFFGKRQLLIQNGVPSPIRQRTSDNQGSGVVSHATCLRWTLKFWLFHQHQIIFTDSTQTVIGSPHTVYIHSRIWRNWFKKNRKGLRIDFVFFVCLQSSSFGSFNNTKVNAMQIAMLLC